MVSKRILFSSPIGLLFFSCVSYMDIPSKKAAEFIWPQEIRRVGLMDAVYESPGLDANKHDPEHFVNEGMKTLHRILQEGGRFEPEWIKGNHFLPEDSLSDYVSRACREKGLDAVIVFRNMDRELGEAHRDSYYDQDGMLQ